jgi:acyl-CoA synthetase (AMP-forming)/AMP-acid ligase II
VGLPDPEGLRGEVSYFSGAYSISACVSLLRICVCDVMCPLQIVGAFIVLNANEVVPASEAAVSALTSALQLHVRNSLSAHCYPRVIRFVQSLPKTASGKLQRFKIKHEHLAELQQKGKQ